ncbi:imidazolonepropionase [candidate division KSB1 bacterium]|nr:imidazolonepropionase [candidate division KSB1 bacterium]NIR70212.1 imidazolonepropionase [candidate division KSB1 bacterium]NIS26483.1 imidazolonepropionase [candidate division KSB1 bacterium]NIT73245.1 imidazolonepropionase [candidate division KSB1 bacterium]NIU23869.1 imidazolonepropionase [candidate division KSB1 bacterium]
MKADFLLKNAQLATPLGSPEFVPAKFIVIENAVLAAHRGKIVFVAENNKEASEIELEESAQVIDCNGKTVTPGFVDCHTHPVFHGTREDEFEMRVMGKTYEEIARSGGGIKASVRSLKQASKDELLAEMLPRLDRFLSHGTTTIEAKSGYGLSVEDELKSLEVICEANRVHSLDLVATFLGAHEVPDEYQSNRSDYIDLVIKEMMPLVQNQKLADFCDVFCESHVFNVEESRKILQAAKDLGFGLKIHADQLTHNGGTALAAELGAVSADHLEFSTEKDWQDMLDSQVVPVMLPGAVFFLGKDRYAPAKRMLESGLPVAIATDFNPGTYMSESMPLICTLSCLKLKFTPAQAFTAVTYHAALAINRGNLLGTLEVDKEADLVIWDVPNYKYIPYHFGANLAQTVVKSGKIVWKNESPEYTKY